MKPFPPFVAVVLFICCLQGICAQEVRHNVEVKLIVPAELAGEARKALLPADSKGDGEVVCFYDTADLRFQAAGVILRARHKEGKKAESTVKLTYPDAEAAAADKSTGVEVEEDWVDFKAPRLSRSIDGSKKLNDSQAGKLAAGTLAAADAFDDAQRSLVEKRAPGVDWKEVRCFGPIQARIWKKVPLAGFNDALMTVEDWSMVKADGKTTENILEVSVKGKNLTASELKVFVEAFFQAAEGQKLGRPAGESKTKGALKFFAPGK